MPPEAKVFIVTSNLGMQADMGVSLINAGHHLAGAAFNLSSARMTVEEALRGKRVDVAVLDIPFSGGAETSPKDDVEFMGELRSGFPDIKIIALAPDAESIPGVDVVFDKDKITQEELVRTVTEL